MCSKEIVTLQVGHYSNFVGTHWWNLQEANFNNAAKNNEIDSDIMFREGKTLSGDVTYVPRLISFDLKGSLKSLPSHGTLYPEYSATDNEQSQCKWSGSVEVHKSTPPTKNEFLKSLDESDVNFEKPAEENATTYYLDDKVEVWSDFLHAHLHPKSLYIFNDYLHDKPISELDNYGLGLKLCKSEIHIDSIEDRIRFFVEECNYLQGFHLLLDAADGFSGVGAAISEYLADEFSSKVIQAVPLYNTQKTENVSIQRIRVINTALSLSKLLEHCSITVPISVQRSVGGDNVSYVEFPYVKFQPDLQYHSSAILATALDTVSLCYRRKNNYLTMNNYVDMLTAMNHKLAALSLNLPFQLCESNINKIFDQLEENKFSSLTPSCDILNCTSFVNNFYLRGIPSQLLKSNVPAQELNSPSFHEKFMSFACKIFPGVYNSVEMLHSSCLVASPFPNFWSPLLNSKGSLKNATDVDTISPVNDVPVMAGLHVSTGITTFLTELAHEINKLKYKKMHNFEEVGIEVDEFTECEEILKNVKERFID